MMAPSYGAARDSWMKGPAMSSNAEIESTADVKRVLIVGDHPVVRKGLAGMIGEEPDLHV